MARNGVLMGKLRFLNQVAGEELTEKLTFEYRCKGSEKALSEGRVFKQKEQCEGNIQRRKDAWYDQGTTSRPEESKWKD